MQKELLLEMKGIVKIFPGVKALSGVDLKLHKGEVLAVIGENGAGKSTLMNILLGSLRPDEGETIFKGERYTPKSPADALKSGISMIHQELTLVPEMTVSENIWLGQESRFSRAGYLNVKARERATAQLLKELNVNVPQNQPLKMLSTANMQLVELARAASYNSEVVIMDEPTSSLTNKEIETLYNIVRKMAQNGVGVIFITHKLDEVEAICDTVTVLRDGQHIDTKPIGEITRDEMITKMVGRQLTNMYPKEPTEIGEVVLEVKNLTRLGAFRDISFSARRGEVLGFCGLIGAGRSEVMECLFGIENADEGEVYLKGEPIRIKTPKDAIHHKLAMVTEDRLRRGLIRPLTVKFNMALAYLDQVTKRGFVDDKVSNRDCLEMKEELDIRIYSLDQIAGQLSGGNQQKVIIAKWLLTHSEVLILDEPTRGIDVGAKTEIYKLINQLAKEGKTILLVSSELPEIMGISDRVVVMAEGRKMAEVDRADFSEEALLQYAFGTRQEINEKGQVQ